LEKKKEKVVKLKNNKSLGSKLQGYANGLGLITLKIKGKVYRKRIKKVRIILKLLSREKTTIINKNKEDT
jgi:hypothetical protein